MNKYIINNHVSKSNKEYFTANDGENVQTVWVGMFL